MHTTGSPKLPCSFFARDVLEAAPELLGKYLVRQLPDGQHIRLQITETEAYRGTEDKACHASKGRTPRTEVMYHAPGTIYVYLVYGMHWMLNIVAAEEDEPQAILIRGIEGYNGPGKLTKALQLDKSFNDLPVCHHPTLWLEEGPQPQKIEALPRVGIAYAGEYWASKPWRFLIPKK